MDIARTAEESAELFRDWRVGDRNAWTLELALTRASLQALKGTRAPPTADERLRARKLGATADELSQIAMADMGRRARTAVVSTAKNSLADRQFDCLVIA